MSLITVVVSADIGVDKVPETAETIIKVDGVTEVHSVTGDWGLVVVVHTINRDDLVEVIPNPVNRIDGVTRTQTQLAFRIYS